MFLNLNYDSGQNEVFFVNIEARILDFGLMRLFCLSCRKLISRLETPNVRVFRSIFVLYQAP